MSQINNKSQTFLFTVACYYGRRLPGFIGCCSGDSLSPQQWLFVFVLLCTFNREVIWAHGQSNNWSTLSGGVIDGGDLSCVRRLRHFDLTHENAGLRGVEWLQLQRRHIRRLWGFLWLKPMWCMICRDSHIYSPQVCVCVSVVFLRRQLGSETRRDEIQCRFLTVYPGRIPSPRRVFHLSTVEVITWLCVHYQLSDSTERP